MPRCSYKDCTSKRDGFTRLYRYPVSDKLRCQQWIDNAQKLEYFPVSQIKNRVICEHHFRDDDFQSSQKKRLKNSAVPTLDGPYCDPNYFSAYKNDQHQYSLHQSNLNELLAMDGNEIEIEEHDVLDDPNIKRIFPDLSIIKKEISDYEGGIIIPCDVQVKQETVDEVSKHSVNVEHQVESKPTLPLDTEFITTKDEKPAISSLLTDSKTNTTEALNDSSIATHLRFKTFLDSLVDDFCDISDNSCQSRTETQHSNSNTSKSCVLTKTNSLGKDCKVIGENVFILGSKPSDDCLKNTSEQKRSIKVELTDISTYLNTSKQYCKQCFILFPNIDALKWHINKTHSPTKKIFVSNNKKQPKLESINIKLECDICATQFSSKGNLNKHKKRYNHFKRKSTEKTTEKTIKKLRTPLQREVKIRNTNSQLNANNKTEITESHYCFHCTKVFHTHNSLIEHLYDAINPNKTTSKPAEHKGNSAKIDVADKNTNADKVAISQKITCNVCYLEFTNEKDLGYHFKEYHTKKKTVPNNKNKSDRKHRVLRTPSVDREKTQIVENNGNSDLEKIDQSLIDKNEYFNQEEIHIFDKKIERDKTECVENNILNCINDESFKVENYDTDCDNQDSDSAITHENSDTNVKSKQVYQCFICSKYIIYFKWYAAHMIDHNVHVDVEVDKTVFDRKCKFCHLEHADIKAYNKHISVEHSDKLDKKIEIDNKAFQSVLFECMKCNVFFLSTNAAKNHSQHKEIFVHWNCSDCQKTFKAQDKSLHLKQHLTNKNIIAYNLSDSALNRVLCKCLKCAVHFSEEEYFLHTSSCELEAPNSVYCNTCDILINKNDMISHEHSHKYKKLLSTDFTIIESVFFLSDVKKNLDEKVNSGIRSKFMLTFCYTCNCFVSDLSSTRKAHVGGRCGIICQRMCKKCGLIFTNRGYLSHKALHDEVKNLTVQSFYFYDIKSKKQMLPPVPVYPKCNICEVHFLNKGVIKQHECSQQKFKTCNICHKKLTETAFKFHMNFHNYKLSNALNKKIVIRLEQEDDKISIAVNKKSNSSKISLPPVLSTAKEATTQQISFVYVCNCCNILLDNYDKVVEHCQVHYGLKQTKTNNHTKINPSDENFHQSIKFDPFYFRFENDVWLKHIFENFSREQIEKIVKDSIYKFECRLLLEEIQPGPSNLIVYKCNSCKSYIDPVTIYSHVGIGCRVTKKHPCSHCGLCFYSEGYLITHEMIHDRPGINVSSYKIVLFNKREHRQFTKIMHNSCDKFILYQCRNCKGVIDKLQRENHQCYHSALFKCEYCELIFYEQEYNYHLVKHKTIKDFDNEHIIIIMFGKPESSISDSPKPSFSGTIYDLTFYKCTNCRLCLETEDETTDHVCVSNSSKFICPKCLLCFLKKDYDTHLNLHKNNIELDYSDFCSNIIPFNTSVIEINDNETMEVDELEHNENNLEKNIVNSISNLKEIIYKCDCGLHFLEKRNILKHNKNCSPKMKISKQNCFRCDLLFTPGELFNHLLKHHSNKKVKYDYDIISINI